MRHYLPIFIILCTLTQSACTKEDETTHPFLIIDKNQKQLTIKKGSWHVKNWINVPENFTLIIKEGTRLQFSENTGLISHGKLNFLGSKKDKIILEGHNNNHWQGIAVIDVQERSHWKYVTIKNTTNTKTPDMELTGGVTFDKSPVTMENGLFEGHIGEDALNIIHTEFSLIDTDFKNTASDAFDSDFSQGSVIRGRYENIGIKGGDGIDVSGSQVKVHGTIFINISDKALSVGEKSQLHADEVEISNSGTGAASKDGSTLFIKNSVINNTTFAGLTAYIKKPKYGPARIEATNIKFNGPPPKTIVQTGSVIILDGKAVPTQDVDVDKLYRTIMKKGADL